MSAQPTTCPRCGAELIFRDDGTAERCSTCSPASPPPLPRRSRRDDRDFDDDLPHRRRSPPPKKQARAFPFAIVIGVGLGALVVISLIVAIAIADRTENPSERGQVAKSTTVENKPGPDDWFGRPREPGKLAKPPAKVEPIVIPPLPPPEDRPNLVLDAGGHSATVKATFFSPDGTELITVSGDKTVRIWDADTGDTLHTFRLPVGPGVEGALSSAAISPDGKLLAVAGSTVGLGKHGVLIYLLSLDDGKLVRVFKGHRNLVTCLAFSPNGKWLASGCLDNTGIVWEVATGLVGGELIGHTGRLWAIEFHPKDGSIATTSQDETVRIWTHKEGKFESISMPTGTPCLSLSWRPDGKKLATGGVDGSIQFFTRDGKADGKVGPLVERKPKEGPGPISLVGLRYTPDGKGLLYGGVAFRGQAGIWDIAAGKTKVEFGAHNNTVQSVGISRDGKRAFTTGGDDHESFVWDTDDGEIETVLVAAGRSTWGVGWTRDSKSLLFGHVNHEQHEIGIRPLERSFNLEKLDYGKPPRPDNSIQAQWRMNGYELKRVDFYSFDVLLDGKKHYSLTTSEPKRDRVYAASLVAEDRAVIGTGFGRLILFDLKEKKVISEFRGVGGQIMTLAPSPDGQFLATGSTTQTVSIWRFDKKEPVLTFFPAHREWIAWTPEGYYAASPNGERLMGWQLNNGPEKLGTYLPAIRFHASLFQPEVVKDLFRTQGQLDQAIALAIKEHGKPIDAVNVMQVLPPEVTVKSPTPINGQVKTDKDTIQVVATAKSTGNHAVRSMRLLIDGRPYEGDKGIRTFGQAKPSEVDAAWDVKLPPGSHSFTVLADVGVSKGMSAAIDIVRDAKPRTPNLYILAVGVADYPGTMKLQWAASDAVNLTRTLKEKSKGIFANVDVKLLTDKGGSKIEIEKGLAWLQERMTWEDVGIFFFSGHGAKDLDENFYLVPQDIGRNLARTAVSGDMVRDRLAELPGKLVAIFDACHSGAVADSFEIANADSLARELVGDDYGVVVMCSSQGSEFSLESPEHEGGFFTVCLVEGLRGKADKNRDRVVWIHELDDYATKRTRELSNGEQNAVTGRPPSIRPFPISRP